MSFVVVRSKSRFAPRKAVEWRPYRSREQKVGECFGHCSLCILIENRYKVKSAIEVLVINRYFKTLFIAFFSFCRC